MNIAYLSTFYPFRGGIAQFNALLLSELIKKNHKLYPYTFTTQYPNFLFPGKTQYVTENDKVDIIDSIQILNTINPASWHKTAVTIKNQKPDLLIMKYWMSFFAPSLGYVASKVNKETKVISILDNVIPHEKRFFDSYFTKYFLKQNHGFVAMSNKVKNDLLYLMPNAKVTLIEHPLYNHFGNIQEKINARNKLNINNNKKTILFFGFIRDYKGLDLLIEAFGLLNDTYQLVIAGEVYGNFDKYNEMIEKNNNKNNIYKHIKYISDDEVSSYFSAADVCVLPYKSATQSGITAIAYHFRLPIIATKVGGLNETIIHNKTGIIVEKPESNLIAKAIDDFFNNNQNIDYKENINKLCDELSWNKFAEKLLDFYNKNF